MTYQFFYLPLYYFHGVVFLLTRHLVVDKNYYANMGPKPCVHRTGAYSRNEYEISNKGFRLYPQEKSKCVE